MFSKLLIHCAHDLTAQAALIRLREVLSQKKVTPYGLERNTSPLWMVLKVQLAELVSETDSYLAIKVSRALFMVTRGLGASDLPYLYT
jgi:hypothetical protein